MTQKAWSQDDRNFLHLVSKAAFANPFSDDRADLDHTLSGLSRTASKEKVLEAVLQRIQDFLHRTGHTSPQNQQDAQLLLNAHLFTIFHRHIDSMDALIVRQIATGEESCHVPFAEDILKELAAVCPSRHETLLYVALFYQIRRAYHFIDRSLIGRSASMKALRRSLWNSVFTSRMDLYAKRLWSRLEDFATLLLGETGTGKGAAATAIGRSGFIPLNARSACFEESFMRSFIAIHLPQYPESLIESELFGHRKGSFTGAVEAHEGIFSRCSPHGAIFLDEIGDATVPVQIKLLQILQERTFSPVGSHEKRRFSGRVIAATNRPVDKLRETNLFREDFYYRLCSDTIVVPPLRQRLAEDPGELHDLLNLTVDRILGEDRRSGSPSLFATDLVDMAEQTILQKLGHNYPWPGNVRELEQCVRRIILTGTCEKNTMPHQHEPLAALTAHMESGTCTADELLSQYCALLYKTHGTYEEVARRSGLDRRTARKYVLMAAHPAG